eukprot:6170817-Pleurochrysis_carterae.AAC.1
MSGALLGVRLARCKVCGLRISWSYLLVPLEARAALFCAARLKRVRGARAGGGRAAFGIAVAVLQPGALAFGAPLPQARARHRMLGLGFLAVNTKSEWPCCSRARPPSVHHLRPRQCCSRAPCGRASLVQAPDLKATAKGEAGVVPGERTVTSLR